ncbi:succinylglutamate desuccinylase/aspartoacylase family protein [Micromonospora sp. STR1s_5]|nr:succinylglutamate desuccinylase/aspartoacylase family protein [Micromonospora sp. STR1s_5]
MSDIVLETTRFATGRPGPRLLVLGAVHGNETCGPQAIDRVLAAIRSGSIALRRGDVTFLPVANPRAFGQNTREGERNLNRDLRERSIPRDNEDRLGNLLCPLLRAHDVLLDLHSFTGPAAFRVRGTARQRGADRAFRSSRSRMGARHPPGRRARDSWLARRL